MHSIGILFFSYIKSNNLPNILVLQKKVVTLHEKIEYEDFHRTNIERIHLKKSQIQSCTSRMDYHCQEEQMGKFCRCKSNV